MAMGKVVRVETLGGAIQLAKKSEGFAQGGGGGYGTRIGEHEVLAVICEWL